jgi:CubicO group peptidase (beta-lactamase class C family)
MNNIYRFRSFILFFVLFLFPLHIAGQSGVSDKLEKYMRAQVEVYGFGGAVLVVKDDKVLLKKAYGLADLEWNTPNTVDTKFSLASVSKQFTAAAILQLAERGKLSLDDKLSKFLPDFPKGDRVSIHMLLTHTSGLGHDFDDLYMKQVGLTREEAVPLIGKKPYDFEPGEKFGYSNTGYFLLALIVEKASGEEFSDYMSKNVFQPAGMNNSGISKPDVLLPKQARTYFRPAGVFLKTPYINWTLNVGLDGVYSTVEDLYKWHLALKGGKILSPASLKKMQTPYIESYGYGLGIFELHKHRIIAHAGSFFGASTTLDKYPDDDLFITVLSNNEGGPSAPRISTGLSAIVFGLDVEIPYKRVEVKIDSALYDKYVGKYGRHEIVKTDDGKLLYKNSNDELRPESKTKFFFAKKPHMAIEFVPAKTGEINSLIFLNNGVKNPFEKSK